MSAVARRRTSKRGEFGSLYDGKEGQWSWALHRITGVAIILFLFAHVVDTAVVGWGPEAYNKVMAAYSNPLVRSLELGLVAAVLFHAINGVKIMLVDFWPKAALIHRQLTYGAAAIFVLAMIPITLVMGKDIIESF